MWGLWEPWLVQLLWGSGAQASLEWAEESTGVAKRGACGKEQIAREGAAGEGSAESLFSGEHH